MVFVIFGSIKQHANSSITYCTSPHQYQYTHPTSGVLMTVVLSDYGSGVKFQGPGGETFASATITFTPRGMVLPGAGYAYLSNDTNSAYYRIGPLTSGVIRFQKWSGSVWE